MKVSIKNKQELYGLGYPYGGFLVDELETAYGLIVGGYNTQHNSDDTHGTITASGPISERGRTTPMGEWTDIPLAASQFTGAGTMTWTVPDSTSYKLSYTLIGNTMTLGFVLLNTTVGVGGSTPLRIKLPLGLLGVRYTDCLYYYSDNGGAYTVGIAETTLNVPYLDLYQVPTGTLWTASTALTSVRGTATFEVK